MNFTLEWQPSGTAYVVADAEQPFARRRVGHLRQRGDGTWLAHAWPAQLTEALAKTFDTFEDAAGWCADEWELPRPPRPPLEGKMPRAFKRSEVEQVSISSSTQGATP